MTSQKRYRHHQENHNARYRDLPPRFKRQKSSTSPTPAPVSSADNILQEISSPASENNKPPVPSTEMTSPAFFKASDIIDSCENLSKVKSPATTTNPLKWSALPRKEVPVLSPVDNQFFNFTPTVHIPLGTQFGYSPPLSPWNMSNMSVYSGQPTSVYKNDPWSQPPGESYGNQTLLSPAKLNLNNENHVPLHNIALQKSPVSQWTKPAFSPQLSSNMAVQSSSLIQSTSNLKNNQRPATNISPKPNIDYSDPDIRTIEMLRELERVADEKQNDDFGVDRKSLVSHHLRMLMCAVDRYTEGIEDEINRKDEVAVTESPAHTPSQQSPAASVTRQNTPTVPTMWQKDHANNIVAEKEDSKNKHFNATWMLESTMESSRMTTSNDNKKREIIDPEMSVPLGTWDLWSSPSFDICDFLSHPLPCNFSESELPHFDLFGSCNRGDSFNIDEVRQRKPLYKR